MQWALLIALTANDPAGAEIARFERLEDCQQRASVIWAMGVKAAEENRGKGEPSDLYGICRSVSDGQG